MDDNEDEEEIKLENKKPPKKQKKKKNKTKPELPTEEDPDQIDIDQNINTVAEFHAPHDQNHSSINTTSPQFNSNSQNPSKLNNEKRDFLEQKLEKIAVEFPHNDVIVKGVSKGLDETNRSIEEDLKSNRIKIIENASKIEALNQTNRELQTRPNNISIVEKSRNHRMKELKEKEENLKTNLAKLHQEEHLLEGEGYINLTALNNSNVNASNQNNGSIVIEHNIRKDKLRDIKRNKDILQAKWNEIHFQISKVLEKEAHDRMNKNQIIQEFLVNFEHDKAKSEEKLRNIKTKISTDMNKIYETIQKDRNNRIKRFEEIDKTQQEEARIKQEWFHSLHKEMHEKRSKINKEKRDHAYQFINCKPLSVKDYITSEEHDWHRKEKEERLISLEKEKRRSKMRHIPWEEIVSFSKQCDEKQQNLETELKEKALQMKEWWKERAKLLPKSETPLERRMRDEWLIQEEEKQKWKDEIRKRVETQTDYGKKVSKKFIPKLNEKLQNELAERIKILNHVNKMHVSKSTKAKRGRIILKKIDPNKYKWKLKLQASPTEVEENEYKKPKRVQILKTSNDREHIRLDKPIDYLLEQRKKKSPNKTTENNGGVYTNDKNNQIKDSREWQNILNNKHGSIWENIQQVRIQASIYENEALKKKQILKYNGGIESLPEIGDEIGNLYINSIQAKWEILKAMNWKEEGMKKKDEDIDKEGTAKWNGKCNNNNNNNEKGENGVYGVIGEEDNRCEEENRGELNNQCEEDNLCEGNDREEEDNQNEEYQEEFKENLFVD